MMVKHKVSKKQSGRSYAQKKKALSESLTIENLSELTEETVSPTFLLKVISKFGSELNLIIGLFSDVILSFGSTPRSVPLINFISGKMGLVLSTINDWLVFPVVKMF